MSHTAALAKLTRRGAWLRDAGWQAIAAAALFVVAFLTLALPDLVDRPTRGQIEVPVTDGLGWRVTEMSVTRQTAGFEAITSTRSPVTESVERTANTTLVDPIEWAKKYADKSTIGTENVDLQQADAIKRLAAHGKSGPNPFTDQDYADLATVQSLLRASDASDNRRREGPDPAIKPPTDYIKRSDATTAIFAPVLWLVAATILFGIDQWVGRAFAVRRRWRWPVVGAAIVGLLVPIIAYVSYMTAAPEAARSADSYRVRTVALIDPRARLATRSEARAQEPACGRVPPLDEDNCLAARGWYVLEETGNAKRLDAHDTELHYALAQHAWLNHQPDRLIAHLDKVVPMFLVLDPSTSARLDAMARDAIDQRPQARARLVRFLVDGGDVVRHAMLFGTAAIIAGLLVVALASLRLGQLVKRRLGRIAVEVARSVPAHG